MLDSHSNVDDPQQQRRSVMEAAPRRKPLDAILRFLLDAPRNWGGGANFFAYILHVLPARAPRDQINNEGQGEKQKPRRRFTLQTFSGSPFAERCRDLARFFRTVSWQITPSAPARVGRRRRVEENERSGVSSPCESVLGYGVTLIVMVGGRAPRETGAVVITREGSRDHEFHMRIVNIFSAIAGYHGDASVTVA